MDGVADTLRNKEIQAAYQNFKLQKKKGGLTVIAKQFGVTKQRIYQILQGPHGKLKTTNSKGKAQAQYVEFDPNKLEPKESWERLKKKGLWPSTSQDQGSPQPSSIGSNKEESLEKIAKKSSISSY